MDYGIDLKNRSIQSQRVNSPAFREYLKNREQAKPTRSLLRTLMKIELGTGNIVEVELGRYVYDEMSDTWIAWDLLDEPTKIHMEALANELAATTETMKAAIKNAVKIVGGGSMAAHDSGYLS